MEYCKIQDNKITGPTNGIYLNGSANHVIFCNVVTVCDVCLTEVSTTDLWRGMKGFQEVLERSHYKKDDWHKIHVLGICDKCKRKKVK